MARVAFPLVLQSPVTGSALVGATATITKHVVGASLGSGAEAEIFTTETESTKVSGNKIVTDNTGRWTQGEAASPAYAQYWLPQGTYDVLISGSGLKSVYITRGLVSGEEESVGTPLLANLAVTTAKIASEAVTAAKIATGAVTEPKIASEAVTAAKIATGAVTEPKIANEAVTAAKLASSIQTELKDSLGSQGIGAPGGRTSASFGTEYEPSSSRPTEVILDIGFGGATGEHGVAQVYVSGVLRSEPLLPSLTSWTTIASVSFICPPGAKWSVSNVTNGVDLHYSYLTL